MSWYGEWRPYVPVAQRRARAASYAAKLAKKEKRTLAPVQLDGRTIAQSFWGQAWCDNLERYSDFENRLPRGRSYVRNGSVIDLQIARGKVKAFVSGSEVYHVTITIETLSAALKRIDAALDIPVVLPSGLPSGVRPAHNPVYITELADGIAVAQLHLRFPRLH